MQCRVPLCVVLISSTVNSIALTRLADLRIREHNFLVIMATVATEFLSVFLIRGNAARLVVTLLLAFMQPGRGKRASIMSPAGTQQCVCDERLLVEVMQYGFA